MSYTPFEKISFQQTCINAMAYQNIALCYLLILPTSTEGKIHEVFILDR